jgi:uncharacterized protein (TIGR02246 family)
MNRSDVTDWVQRYVVAWNSNDPDDIRALFTEDAHYLTEPYADPWRGPDEILHGWLDHKDEPGETDFAFEVIAIEDDLAIVRGRTLYRTPPRTYDNLWEITLDRNGKATRFVEWWMKLPDEGA